jgi:hypothetical protein
MVTHGCAIEGTMDGTASARLVRSVEQRLYDQRRAVALFTSRLARRRGAHIPAQPYLPRISAPYASDRSASSAERSTGKESVMDATSVRQEILGGEGTPPGGGGTLRRSYKSSGPRHVFGKPPRLDDVFVAPKLDTAYDVRIAYAMSVAAGWAYANGQTLADELQYYGFPDGAEVEEISIVNQSMYVVALVYFVRSKDGRVGVLSFRGTMPTDFINWLTDSSTSLETFEGGGSVHSGFLANVRAVWADVDEHINHALDPDAAKRDNKQPLRELYLTGHSLGAAMAVVAAARMFQDPKPGLIDYEHWRPIVKGVYLFGQPRVGDERFCDVFGNKLGDLTFRHTFACDAIPHLPPYIVGRGYAPPFGNGYFAASDSDPWTLDASHLHDRRALGLTWPVLCILASSLARRVDPLRQVRPPYSIYDHSTRWYIAVSQNSCPERPIAGVTAAGAAPWAGDGSRGERPTTGELRV